MVSQHETESGRASIKPSNGHFWPKATGISKKISSLNAPERIQDEKIKRLEANVESLNKLFEQVAQENRNTRKSVELTILDRIKDTRAYVDRKYADVTDDLNKEPSLKIIYYVKIH